MQKIKPTTFNITKEEVEDILNEMIEEELFQPGLKLSRKQIVEILICVECDDLLAKDIRSSIRGSIVDVLC